MFVVARPQIQEEPVSTTRSKFVIEPQIRFEGERIGKPTDESHAIAMLATLSGREHEVRTDVVVIAASGARREFAVRSRVTLRDLSLRQIERYVGTGEPLDKAGAYAIQGEGRRSSILLRLLRQHRWTPVLRHFALRRVGVVPRSAGIACQAPFAFECPVGARRSARTLARDGVDTLLSEVLGRAALGVNGG